MLQWKKLGFTQRKPKEPGVYFIRTDGHLPMAPAHRLEEHWDVAEVTFYAGDFFNPSKLKEEGAHWRIQTLNGLSYAWRQGVWLKGPIRP